jgi:hypothetical protein
MLLPHGSWAAAGACSKSRQLQSSFTSAKASSAKERQAEQQHLAEHSDTPSNAVQVRTDDKSGGGGPSNALMLAVVCLERAAGLAADAPGALGKRLWLLI